MDIYYTHIFVIHTKRQKLKRRKAGSKKGTEENKHALKRQRNPINHQREYRR